MQETMEEKEVCLEKAKAKRMQETAEEKEVHLGKAKPKRMQETTEEKEVCLEKAQKKRETEIQQKLCESKGFIKDEQQWLITGPLHKPAEFTSEEDRKKFESQLKSHPGVTEADRLRHSIFTSVNWQLGTLEIEIKMVVTTLARWMRFVDIVVEKSFEQRSKAISQVQIRRNCLILEASVVGRGVFPKAQKLQSASMIGVHVYI